MALTREKHVLLMVFIALFFDIASFSMNLPLFPAILDFYAKQPAGTDGLFTFLNVTVNEFREAIGAPQTQRWNSVLFGGAIGSLFSMLQYASSPLFGTLSDIYGRKIILLLTTLGMASSFAVWATSGSFGQFVLARVICGLSKGSTGIYSAVVTDVSNSETRNSGMVVVGLAYSLGFIVGPMCGAWLSAYVRSKAEGFFVMPALVAMAFALLDMLIIALLLPETNRLVLQRREEGATEKQQKVANSASLTIGQRLLETLRLIEPISVFRFSSIRDADAATRGILLRYGFSYYLFLVLFAGVEFNLTFLASTRFAYDSMQQGRMFVFIGVTMMIFQAGVVRRVSAGKEQLFAVLGVLAMLPAGLILAFSDSHLYFYVALTMYTFSSASVVPCLTTCVSRYGGAHEKGKLLGILRSLGSLARAIGPLLFASIFWLYGVRVAYAIAGLSMLLPISVLYSIKRVPVDESKKSE